MKKVQVEKAVGMTLCHDITAMRDGFKGAAFRRGHVITEEDVPKLLDLGKRGGLRGASGGHGPGGGSPLRGALRGENGAGGRPGGAFPGRPGAP